MRDKPLNPLAEFTIAQHSHSESSSESDGLIIEQPQQSNLPPQQAIRDTQAVHRTVNWQPFI